MSDLLEGLIDGRDVQALCGVQGACGRIGCMRRSVDGRCCVGMLSMSPLSGEYVWRRCAMIAEDQSDVIIVKKYTRKW